MSTGSLIGGIIGAVIGFYAGGNVAAGWAIGSAVGGAVDPDVIDGPRLNDRTVQVSTYGASIAIIYGGVSGTGNVIWATDLVEHDVEAGKGGPAVLNHTYSVSCAILIGEPPLGGTIASIRRIWADAKLVVDFSETADSATLAASLLFWNHCTFYTGSEAQLPDPTMELALGAGNVSAYKGLCYVVMTDLPLQDYGNRLPQFRFETTTETPQIVDTGAIKPLELRPWEGSLQGPRHAAGGAMEFVVESTTGAQVGSTYTDFNSAYAAMLAYSGGIATSYIGYWTSTPAGGDSVMDAFNAAGGAQEELAAGQGPRYVWLGFNVGQPNVIVNDGAPFGAPLCGALNLAGAVPHNGSVYMFTSTTDVGGNWGHAGLVIWGNYTIPPTLWTLNRSSMLFQGTSPGGARESYVNYLEALPSNNSAYCDIDPIYFTDINPYCDGAQYRQVNVIGLFDEVTTLEGRFRYRTANAWGGWTFQDTPAPTSNAVEGAPPGYNDGVNNCAYVYETITYSFPAYFSQHYQIRMERKLSLPAPSCVPGDPCVNGIAEVPSNPEFCITCDGTVSQKLTYSLETGTFKQLQTLAQDSGVYGADVTRYPLGPILRSTDPLYNDQPYWDAQAVAAGIVGTYGVDYAISVTQAAAAQAAVGVVAGGSANLADIVADLCKRAGMADSAVNVTALAAIPVQGYAVAREMPARSAIAPLQQCFWWDFVESERKLKAVLRGAAPVATIGLADLGATEGDDSPIAVLPNRAQESELPQIVEVSYPCRLSGYETSTQRDRRTTTASRQKINIESAVVQTDQHAANMAQVLMYMSWTNRTSREWSTTRKFSHIEPTDVLTLDDGEFIVTARITEKSEEGPVIKWKGVDERPASYTPNATPAASGVGIGGVRFDGPMKLELIDSPLVDESDDAGIYAVAAGYRTSWPGGTAFKSTDAGASYTSVRKMTQKGTLGYALSVLPGWQGGNTVDESSTVTIRMHSGTLSTITQAALLNDGNMAILGSELLQFKRAELIAADTYLLTGLLRARKGTEQHTGTHAINDRFVLFTPTTTYRLSDTLPALNAPAKWKGVTDGQTLDDATAIDFTNTGAGLKPLAPVHLHATDIGGGQYRITWTRRTRIGGSWRDGVDAPLSETSESYAVVILNGATVLSTTATSTSTLDVAAVAGNTVNVYQNSSTVGRGFAATVTLT